MAPYNVDKAHGGDSPENTKKVESCVRQIMQKQPHMDESHAIAICKSSIFGKKESK